MKYRLNAILINDTYTLTGADADAYLEIVTERKVNFYTDNVKFTGQVKVCGLNGFKVTGARISSKGLSVVGNNRISASLNFNLRKGDDVSGDILASFEVPVVKWNEWEEKDIVVKQTDPETTALNDVATLFLTDATIFNIYDFNVQSDMVGQDVVPIIELEIECDKLLDASTGLAI